MSALTNDGSSAIQQTVSVSDSHSHSSYVCLSRHLEEYTVEQFDECYKIAESVDIIIRNRFKTVALQFPDDLLMDASLVSFQLKNHYRRRMERDQSNDDTMKRTNESNHEEPPVGDIEDFNTHSTLSLLSQLSINSEYTKQHHLGNDSNHLRVYILGDTSYGSCCVDEVGAQHILADFIIHYGNACLQPVKRTPVFHVFGVNYKLDANECAKALNNFVEETPEGEVIVIYDLVNYERIKKDLIPLVQSPRVVFSKLFESRVLQNISGNTTTEISENETKISNQIFPKPSEKARFFFIGELGSFITQFMMEYNTHSFKVYSGYKNKIENDSMSAKEAQVFGILVATVSVENYLKMVEYVKRLIIDNNRKFYLFFVGKLNVPKLANFMEIDMFVLIGCSQNSLIESREYVKPIITPFELELALKYGKEWTGYYQLDFNRLFEDENHESHTPVLQDDTESYSVSLISGSVYRVGKSTASSQEILKSKDDGKSLVLQEQQQRQLVQSQYTPSMLFLKNRTYKGLGQDADEDHQNEGDNPPATYATIEQGRSGIASSYSDERH
ncbi:hypothetical protein FDP41_003251 [Naegleria fowleri]|uniref:2-(3-amino-3-carboxypropyl)histidine synthase subunit 2 n=1 Tax=Naegleria fowleri TaxID=5763 RepID=A0A6A5BYC2_NAEFO|nr:uncharacterized protein FDP41_003251 [Naegleria fowleri]KAF0977929.1 hypothetical protein FDP41_003251 [Naegleria fowleri]